MQKTVDHDESKQVMIGSRAVLITNTFQYSACIRCVQTVERLSTVTLHYSLFARQCLVAYTAMILLVSDLGVQLLTKSLHEHTDGA